MTGRKTPFSVKGYDPDAQILALKAPTGGGVSSNRGALTWLTSSCLTLLPSCWVSWGNYSTFLGMSLWGGAGESATLTLYGLDCFYLNWSYSTVVSCNPFWTLISTVLGERRGEIGSVLSLFTWWWEGFFSCEFWSLTFQALPSMNITMLQTSSPGADGFLGISYKVAKKAGIETQISKGQFWVVGIVQSVACFSPPPMIFPFPLLRRVKMNQQTFIELPGRWGTLWGPGEQEDESDSALAPGV